VKVKDINVGRDFNQIFIALILEDGTQTVLGNTAEQEAFVLHARKCKDCEPKIFSGERHSIWSLIKSGFIKLPPIQKVIIEVYDAGDGRYPFKATTYFEGIDNPEILVPSLALALGVCQPKYPEVYTTRESLELEAKLDAEASKNERRIGIITLSSPKKHPSKKPKELAANNNPKEGMMYV